jgi:hypothetical protein
MEEKPKSHHKPIDYAAPPSGIPTTPKNMNKDEKVEFERTVDAMKAAGTISLYYSEMIALRARLIVRLNQLRQAIELAGGSIEYMSKFSDLPKNSINFIVEERLTQKQLVQIDIDLGLTPRSAKKAAHAKDTAPKEPPIMARYAERLQVVK